MASLRKFKKEVDYLVKAVLSDCYTSLMFRDKSHDEIIEIIEDAVSYRNQVIEQVNNPVDKKNRKLVRSHYITLRSQMFDKIDSLFSRLSDVCKS